MRYYIYKLYFNNGCTYIGKHTEKAPNDGYITSSSYYKKHKELLERREILLDNLPDIDTLDIMESICIMSDICENDYNVNRNKGTWLSPNKFDRGFKGPANGMYGRKMSEVMGDEEYKELIRRQTEIRRKNYLERNKDFIESHNGMTPVEYNAYRKRMVAKHTEEIRAINREIRVAHKNYNKYIKSLPHFWSYNPDTLVETYSYYLPEGNIKGRIPHELWTDERKKSYAEKHTFNPFRNKSEEWMEEHSNKQSQVSKGRVWYTNGIDNKFLFQGEDIPEGYWRGLTFKKSELYKATRCGRKQGSKNKWRKQ